MPISLIEPPVIALPHLGFQSFPPHASLHPWVQCYWVIRQTLENNVVETLYPDGGSSLHFTFFDGHLPQITFSASQIARQVQFAQSVDAIGVRFNPGGAFRLLGVDMRNPMENESDLQGLAIKGISELQKRLSDVHTAAGRILLIEQWLLQHLTQTEQKLIQHILPRWLNSNQKLDVFVQQESLSRRQLERRFQLEIGMAPAQLKILQRVKMARQLIAFNPQIPLTDIAQDAGFYDQPHFIRHFQSVTGQTPGHYKKRKMSQMYNSPED